MAKKKLSSGSTPSPSKSIPTGSITIKGRWDVLQQLSEEELKWLYEKMSRSVPPPATDFNTFVHNANWGYAHTIPYNIKDTNGDILYKGMGMDDLSYPFDKTENRDVWHKAYDITFSSSSTTYQIISKRTICVICKGKNKWTAFSSADIKVTYDTKAGVAMTLHDLQDVTAIYFAGTNMDIVKGLGFINTQAANYTPNIYIFDYNTLIEDIPYAVRVVASEFYKELVDKQKEM